MEMAFAVDCTATPKQIYSKLAKLLYLFLSHLVASVVQLSFLSDAREGLNRGDRETKKQRKNEQLGI